jgi:hypothetical protein
MKRISCVLIFFCSCLSTFGQLKETDLLPVFGKIRADMVIEACRIAGFDDTNTVNAIETGSLQKFLEKVKAKDTKLYNIVKKANRPLQGADIRIYIKELSLFADTLLTGLETAYPDKKQDIEKMKSEYTNAINSEDVKSLHTQQYNTNKQTLESMYLHAQDSIGKLQIDIKQKDGKLQDIETEFRRKLDEERQKYDEIQAQIADQKNTHTVVMIIFVCVVIVLFVLLFILSGKRTVRKAPPSAAFDKENIKRNDSNNLPESEHPIPAVPSPVSPQIPESPKPKPSKPKPSKPEQTQIIQTDNVAFAIDADEWIAVGASVTGNGHIAMNLPCQDSHKYEYWGNGWGIAIVSDGAGSALNSHIGSKLVTHRGTVHFKTLAEREGWIQNSKLPGDIDWFRHSYSTLKLIRNEVERFANEKNYPLKSLSATVIVLIHSPYGILTVHVGDGRAGYKNENGEWKALITPHKGEEANQTVFLTSEFWNIPNYTMSGVLVPESTIVREKPFAFTLMSDGCENTAWQYYQKNMQTGYYYDPNKPHPAFFNSLETTLQSYRNENVDLKERKNSWKNFIESGNRSFVKEQDDKTMVLGVLHL